MKPFPFGPYLLLERLAIGGMAEVWLARNQGPAGFRKVVALKRILPNIAEDQEFIQMFVEEAKIAGQLAHPAIAQIFDLGKVGQTYYIALEYIPGVDVRTLWDRVRNRGGFPLSVACHLVARLCEGLDFAHRRKDARGKPLGIIHRDVSPQNVLVSFDGDVKIIDFGIAKAANRAVRTQTGILKGKFAYMAPEHARGLAMDHRADVYAIGVILHELITGERLFRADSDFSLLEKVRKGEVFSPRQTRPDTPAELERIVMKALAARPDDRYPWASHMQADLERFLVSSRRSSSREDLSQFVRDHFPDHHKAELARQKEAEAAPEVAPNPLEVSEPLMERPPGGTTMFGTGEMEPLTNEMEDASGEPDSVERTDVHPDAQGPAEDESWAAPGTAPAVEPSYVETPPTRVDEPGPEVRAARKAQGAAVAPSAQAPTVPVMPAARTPRAADKRAAYAAAVGGPTVSADELSGAGEFSEGRTAPAVSRKGPTLSGAQQKLTRPELPANDRPPPPTLENTSDGISEPDAPAPPPPRRVRLEDSGPQSLVPEPARAPAPREFRPTRDAPPAREPPPREVAPREPPRRDPPSDELDSDDPSLDAAVPTVPPSPVERVRAQAAPSAESSIHSADTSPGSHVPAPPPPSAAPKVIAGVVGGLLLGMGLMVGLMRTGVLGRGTLVVRTGMGTAKVTIEDRPAVTGDVVVDVLRVGKVKVTVEEPRHKPDIQLVEVFPNRITEVKYAAIAAQGSLRILTTPPGATVYLNKDRKPGVTPMTLDDLPPDGIQELVLRHPETQEEKLSVETRKGDTYVVEKALRFLVSRVQVETVPEDAVLMEGKDVKGRKSVIKVKLGSSLDLRVMRPGCQAANLEVLGSGAEVFTEKVTLKCDAMDAELNIEEPAGAHLTVDRVDTGLTVPVRGYRLPATRHRFEIVSKGKVLEWEEKLLPGPQTLAPP